jgi:hypothetical protein
MPTHQHLNDVERLKVFWTRQRLRCLGTGVLFVSLASLWINAIMARYATRGLFASFGVDFAHYVSQTTVFWSIGPDSMYSLTAINNIYQQLLQTYIPSRAGELASPVPYLPLYAWLFTPFTIPSPPIGFVIWDGLGLLAGCYLVWRAAQLFPKDEQACGSLLILVSFPFMYCLYVGQPMIFMACAVAGCYRSLRLGDDFKAGLWTACLLFKPNYGLLLGLLLIYKGRWRAVAGAVVGGVIVIGGSILVAGLPTVLAYPTSLQEHARFRSGSEEDMINWLSIILELRPGIGDFKGMLLEQFLNAVTVLGVAWAWRGPWKPHAANFPIQFTLVILATLIANHHSFNYGAVLLAVPLASVMAEGQLSPLSRLIVIAGILLPTLSFTVIAFIDPSRASRILACLLLLCFVSLFVELWLRGQHMGQHSIKATA